MVTRRLLPSRIRVFCSSFVATLLFSVFVVPAMQGQQRVVAARTIATIERDTEAVDVGPTPVSQPMRLTLRLAPTAERQAALDQLLANQTKVASTSHIITG